MRTCRKTSAGSPLLLWRRGAGGEEAICSSGVVRSVRPLRKSRPPLPYSLSSRGGEGEAQVVTLITSGAAASRARQRKSEASVFVIVLWITFGLVSITLYFANAMNFELRASDNRVCALQSEQAIMGAARYLSY